MLHEALDRRAAGAVIVAHPLGDIALEVEGQPVLGAAGDDVQMAAHRPEKILRLLELAQLDRGQQPGADQFRHRADVKDVFADPEQRVEIAQPAFALFQIGLDDIAAVAHPAVTIVALGELLGDEGRACAAHHVRIEAPRRLVVQRLVAPHETALEQARCAPTGRRARS